MRKVLLAVLIFSFALPIWAEETTEPGAVAPGQQDLPRVKRFDMPAPPPQLEIAPGNPEMIKATYLGVTGTPAQEIIQSQLGLPIGVGLIVENVAKDSPAEKAGINTSDILHKLNDQLLINPEQLSVLVRTFKPGDTITLTVIRQGKPLELQATLVEKEMPRMFRGGMAVRALPLPAMPDFPAVVPNIVVPNIENLPDMPNVQHNFTSTRTLNDGEHVFSVTEDPSGKRAEIRDKDGNVIFQGPINTPDELMQIPVPLRETIQELEKGATVEFKIFRGVPVPAPAVPDEIIQIEP